MAGKRAPTIERFLDKIEKAEASGCWNWTSCQNGAGYGTLWSPEAGRKVLAHRFSYEAFIGPLRGGELVLHQCDNRRCVNPEHLAAGSYKQNVADMDARKRRVSNPARGADNPGTSKDAETIIAIRRDYVSGAPLPDILTRHGITRSAMHDYVSGKSWSHILGAAGCPGLDALKAEAARRRRNGAKIDKATADAIRARLAAGEFGARLAEEYGLSTSTIADIRMRRIWP